MGLPKRGKHESLSLTEVLSKSDREIDKLIKSGQVPTQFTDAKTLRRAARKDKKQTERALTGEKGLSGLGALIAGLRGGGTGGRNYQNIPQKDRRYPAGLSGSGGTGNRNYESLPRKDRMHPAAYEQLLEKEAKRQGLL